MCERRHRVEDHRNLEVGVDEQRDIFNIDRIEARLCRRQLVGAGRELGKDVQSLIVGQYRSLEAIGLVGHSDFGIGEEATGFIGDHSTQTA